MRESEKAMFTGISMNLVAEKSLRWQRSQMFLLLHSAALTFTLAQYNRDFRFLLTAGFVGIVFSAIWIVTIWRTDKWVLFWQGRLAALEESAPDENQVQVFSGQGFKTADHVPTFNQILWTLAIIVALVWFGVLVAGLVFHPIPPVPAGK